MTIPERGYQKAGRNELIIPTNLASPVISLHPVKKIKIKVTQPFNFLYTLWKPSHFYTGLEVHSGKYSWRTFRLSQELFSAAKMSYSDSTFVVEIFANNNLSNEIFAQLCTHIVHSYGLDEPYDVPEADFSKHEYVRGFFEKLKGTRISCPENIFEISIVSLLLQNTNISRTTSMFKKLVESYGCLVTFDDIVLYSFFSPEDILAVSEDELKQKCRLGYRAKYIKNYADFFSRNKEAKLRELSRESLLSLLETIKGVGPYTSNVVASHALRDTEAIPFDSWNRKILALRLYNLDSSDTAQLKKRIISDFGKYSGLIAMYIIENEHIDAPVVPLLSL